MSVLRSPIVNRKRPRYTRRPADGRVAYLAPTLMYYRNMDVWKRALDLATEVYTATNEFPSSELYGLVSQMRRASVSVISNIAEGQGRFSTKEDQQFLLHARGSLFELETQVILSERLGYLSGDTRRRLLKLTKRVGQLVNGTIRSLRRTENGERRTETESGERRTENGERHSDRNPHRG